MLTFRKIEIRGIRSSVTPNHFLHLVRGCLGNKENKVIKVFTWMREKGA